MRKGAFAILLAVLCMVQVYAVDNFSWTLGIAIGKSDFAENSLDDIESRSGSAFDMIGLGSGNRSNKYAIGGETRMRVYFVNLDVLGEFTFVSRQILYFSGMVNIGAGFDFGNSVGLGFSLGPGVEYLFLNRFARDVMTSAGVAKSTFLDAVRTGNFNYRITFDVLVGAVLRVGLAYTLPTAFTLENFNPADLIPYRNTDSKGKFSLCLQMRII